jgi:hypothetical protein
LSRNAAKAADSDPTERVLRSCWWSSSSILSWRSIGSVLCRGNAARRHERRCFVVLDLAGQRDERNDVGLTEMRGQVHAKRGGGHVVDRVVAQENPNLDLARSSYIGRVGAVGTLVAYVGGVIPGVVAPRRQQPF